MRDYCLMNRVPAFQEENRYTVALNSGDVFTALHTDCILYHWNVHLKWLRWLTLCCVYFTTTTKKGRGQQVRFS